MYEAIHALFFKATCKLLQMLDESLRNLSVGSLVDPLFAAYRNAVREQRLAAEISTAKRERDFYLAKVDQSRAFSAMDERRKKVRPQIHGALLRHIHAAS